MSKFKIGDHVRIVEYPYDGGTSKYIGLEGLVKQIHRQSGYLEGVLFDDPDGGGLFIEGILVDEHEIEAVGSAEQLELPL